MWLAGWPAIVQLVLDLALAVPYLLVGVLVVVGITTIPACGIGILVLAVALALGRGLAVFERARLQAFTASSVPPPLPSSPGLPAWRRHLLDKRPWKAVAYLIAMSLWGLVGGLATLVVAALGLAWAVLPLYLSALPRQRLDLFGVVTAPAGWWWGRSAR
jgi:Putative sensor